VVIDHRRRVDHRARGGRHRPHQDHAGPLRLRGLGRLGPFLGGEDHLIGGADILLDEGDGRIDRILELRLLVAIDAGGLPGLGLVGKGAVGVLLAVRVDQDDRRARRFGVLRRRGGLRLGRLPGFRVFGGEVPAGDRLEHVFVRPCLVVELDLPLFTAGGNQQGRPQRDAPSYARHIHGKPPWVCKGHSHAC